MIHPGTPPWSIEKNKVISLSDSIIRIKYGDFMEILQIIETS